MLISPSFTPDKCIFQSIMKRGFLSDNNDGALWSKPKQQRTSTQKEDSNGESQLSLMISTLQPSQANGIQSSPLAGLSSIMLSSLSNQLPEQEKIGSVRTVQRSHPSSPEPEDELSLSSDMLQAGSEEQGFWSRNLDLSNLEEQEPHEAWGQMDSSEQRLFSFADRSNIASVFQDVEEDDLSQTFSVERETTSRTLQGTHERFTQSICENCFLEIGYLSPHLKKSPECLKFYSQKLGVANSIDAVQARRKSIRRTSEPSRSKPSRRLENSKAKSRRNDICHYNNFLKDSLDPKRIIVCSMCKTMKSKSQLKDGLCSQCQNRNFAPPIIVRTNLSNNLVIDSDVYLIPGDRHLENVENNTKTPDKILMPKEYFEDFNSTEGLLGLQDDCHARPGRFPIEDFARRAVEYQQIRLNTKSDLSFYKGKVLSETQQKTVKITKQVHGGSQKVKASREYNEAYHDDILTTIYNCGPLFLSLTLALKAPTEKGFLYTAQQGQEYDVNINLTTVDGEILQPKISLLPKHSGDILQESQPRKLKEVYQLQQHLGTQMTKGRLVSSACNYLMEESNHIKALTRNLFNDKDYTARIYFEDDDMLMKIAVWPEQFADLNKKFAAKEKIDLEDKAEFARWVESHMIASSSKTQLMNDFSLSEAVCEQILDLAQNHQANKCEMSFPSMKTLIKETLSFDGDESVDIKTQEKYFIAQNLLKELLEFEYPNAKENETVEQFLENVKEKDMLSVRRLNRDEIEITFHKAVTLVLSIDDVFKKMLSEEPNEILCFYERISSLKPRNNNMETLLKRPYIKDMYMMPFSPLLLLALKDQMKIKIVGSKFGQEAEYLASCNRHYPAEIKPFEETHDPVSHTEALFIVDATKKLISRSSAPLFVSTSNKDLKTFLKAQTSTQSNFLDIETHSQYIICFDSYSKYLARKGFDNMCYGQFISDFKVEASDDECLRETEEREVKLATDELTESSCLLPRLLELQTGQVVRMRKKRKILKTYQCDKYSEQYYYSNILLYRPHRYPQQLGEEENWKTLFQERPPYSEVRTRIEIVKSRVNPFLCDSFYDDIFTPRTDLTDFSQ